MGFLALQFLSTQSRRKRKTVQRDSKKVLVNLFSHIPRYTFQKFLLLLRLLGRQLHEHFLGPSNSSTRRMESLDFTQGILLAKQSDQLSWRENECKKSFQKRFISSGLWGKKASGIYSQKGRWSLKDNAEWARKKVEKEIQSEMQRELLVRGVGIELFPGNRFLVSLQSQLLAI